MIAGMLALAVAWAEPSQVTLNGVDISSVREQRFTDVDVYIDEHGRIHLSSERYRVEVDAAGAPPSVDGRPARVGPAPATTTAAAPVDRPPDAPPPGSWWLASEDNGTTGHVVVVSINGAQVATIRSGDPQAILDVSAFLRRGINRVTLDMTSTDPTGRTLFVYVGQGANRDGTVALGTPAIQHGLGPTRRGALVREFDLLVE